VPFFWSQHYDVTLAYIGHASGESEIELFGDLERRDATVIYRDAGKVTAVLTVGRDKQSLEFESALERRDQSALDALLTRARTAS